MSYRNLNRAFVLNKAMVSYHRSSGVLMRSSDVFVLLSLSFGCDSIISVQAYLKRFYRTFSLNEVSAKLQRLQGLEYVERSGVKWILTIAGRNALNELERLVRDCRYDK